nr:MAG TPA: hypothetical protein [Caudoviricetes sp.]
MVAGGAGARRISITPMVAWRFRPTCWATSCTPFTRVSTPPMKSSRRCGANCSAQ